VEKYGVLNTDLVEKMNVDLARNITYDFNRRIVRGAVSTPQETLSPFSLRDFDRDDLLDERGNYNYNENHCCEAKFEVTDIDFNQWPKRASKVFFYQRESSFVSDSIRMDGALSEVFVLYLH
jgi:hypothetical protein